MKVELVIFGMTAFFIANTYYDGKYINKLKTWTKYYKMALMGFVGITLWLRLKQNPAHSKNLLHCANNFIKSMPIDKDSTELLTPLLNFGINNHKNTLHTKHEISPSLVNDGTTKRSVSETKKKFVASQQGWTCKKCNQQLSAWFEIDHKMSLEHGGSNDIDNLVALCRNCHGEKTAMDRMNN